ncbi:hypothetical protein FOS14_08020 [Skermania sp. ID1734]|uniref:hypothetical protein n=1 Tax=Skermania sp. ID1734 TaxID=2597516 RepID=UPI00117DFCFA|nr:hypothetical protein [Skermania sp. ID1734]TSE00362.1 hypothetical protein FOS14_08020 [Skermania sp. ID1734]
MDRAVKHQPPKWGFVLLGGDWVEWLIVGLLTMVATLGVGLLTASVVGALFAGVLIFLVSATVVAVL